MRIASDLAGFTMGDADVLRKAMGKKDASVMEAQREKFVEGAVARQVPREQAVTIFNFIEFFAGLRLQQVPLDHLRPAAPIRPPG